MLYLYSIYYMLYMIHIIYIYIYTVCNLGARPWAQTSAFGLLVDQILAAWRPPGFDPLTVGLRPPCVSNPGGLEAARIWHASRRFYVVVHDFWTEIRAPGRGRGAKMGRIWRKPKRCAAKFCIEWWVIKHVLEAYGASYGQTSFGFFG